jgi:hypothetical protein
MKKQTLIDKIRSFDDDLFGELDENESFYPDAQENHFLGNYFELIIGIDKDLIKYEISHEYEIIYTEIENMSEDDLLQIISILENREINK